MDTSLLCKRSATPVVRHLIRYVYVGIPEHIAVHLWQGGILTVRTLTGKSIRVTVVSSDTIENVKRKVQDQEGITPDQQQLIYASHPLENRRTLADYGIEAGDVVWLTLMLRGGELKTTEMRHLSVHLRAAFKRLNA